MSTVASLKHLFSSFLLLELWKGLALTGRHFLSPNITIQFPEEKTPQSPRFRGLHRLQAVRGSLPGHGHHDRIGCA
jgi:NADH-quinone oxidoreductase subunit I